MIALFNFDRTSLADDPFEIRLKTAVLRHKSFNKIERVDDGATSKSSQSEKSSQRNQYIYCKKNYIHEVQDRMVAAFSYN